MKKIFDLKTLIAIIGIVIPIFFFIVSKKVKELSFKNIAINELVSKTNISDESIKVFFDEKRVFNLYSISCILINSGNVPLTKSDYTNNFIIQFPGSINILKYSMKASPRNIVILDTVVNGSKFSILPDLLNPNENIQFSFYVSSTSNNFLPYSNSRIIGGDVLNLNMTEVIKPKTEFSNKAFAKFEGLIFWISFIYTLLFIYLIVYVVYIQKDINVKSPLGKFALFILFSLGLFCNLFYLFETRF